MTKIFSRIYIAIFFSLPTILFGAKEGNIAAKLADNVNQQMTEVGTSVASILNTISIVFGVLWIIVMLFMLFFNMEAVKNHSKYLIGALIVIGVIFGLTASF